MSESQFSDFVRAVQEMDLEDQAVKATSHTSAVSVRDWKSIEDGMSPNEETEK